ncbi:hypothetical protein SHA53_004474 [Salmonella enterica]|nr:hypothetical protein [Salmonella enterica]
MWLAKKSDTFWWHHRSGQRDRPCQNIPAREPPFSAVAGSAIPAMQWCRFSLSAWSQSTAIRGLRSEVSEDEIAGADVVIISARVK